MQAYFLSGVAGKYGLKIEDINALKEIFYGIYMEKTKNPTESIGLPGDLNPPPLHRPLVGIRPVSLTSQIMCGICAAMS